MFAPTPKGGFPGAGAPKGNTNSERYKTSAQRQEVCRLLCMHLRKGLTRSSFGLISRQNLKRYIETYPEDFPIEQIEQAECESIARYEKALRDQIDLGDSKATMFALKNRAPEDWKDKREVEQRTTITDDSQPMNRDDMMLDAARRIAFILASGFAAAQVKGTIIDSQPTEILREG